MKYTVRACSLKETSVIFPKVGNILLIQIRTKLPVNTFISCNYLRVLLSDYALAQESFLLLLSFPGILKTRQISAPHTTL